MSDDNETANPKTDPAPNSNTVKDPDDWTTGEEPMTGAQASYLKTLSEKTDTPYEDGLTKAEASKRIDALRAEAGLGGK
ncbi:hypothetical protein RHAL1_02275 [Beijerinckiaceae bacterium RH AL1]|jgi:Protein of unknown function (DUF3072)|nr:DUF3072 domain-containing protein [Beijerinckiaceae bacterium]VVB46405.1 hypothetical protein RHCH11_RHCH11_02230 [Beijerinckiaceae bacterium RH CH11]VVB46490.1 hypothetical protein RHAL8_02226 [Beijerinckiaceae bacterium RH AL8]VVC55358.1 hypothetical protein RHAL1_02275 [Beijerinckiaceae bacterium RH AL1]